MGVTPIEWTDRTWNPVRGCSRVSEGCRNCYAERVAARFSGRGKPFHGFAELVPRHVPEMPGGVLRVSLPSEARWTGKVALLPEKLSEPLSWRGPARDVCPECDGAGSHNDWKGCSSCRGKGYVERPLRVFVNSMSDLFHEALSNEDIAAVFGLMAATPQHTYQILTKRAARMRAWFAWAADQGEEALAAIGEEPPGGSPVPGAMAIAAGEAVLGRAFARACNAPWPLPNVWLGVSAEDQETADERIPLLLQTPAAVRFVSYEPALGPVDFSRIRHGADPDLPMYPDWVIVGGESGPGARPFDLAWARSVVGRCKAAGVACFVKQLGAQPVDSAVCPDPQSAAEQRGRIPEGLWATYGAVLLSDRKGGDMSKWPENLRVREFPACAEAREIAPVEETT